jgi:hypothetical protein
LPKALAKFFRRGLRISEEIKVNRRPMPILQGKGSTPDKSGLPKQWSLHELPQEFQSVGFDCLV